MSEPQGAVSVRVRVLALLAVSALVFGACSSNAGATASPSSAVASPAAPQAASQPAASASAGGKQFAGRTINVVVNAGYDAEAFHAITKAFQDATGATVNVSYVPFDSLEAKYAALIAAQDSSIDAVEAVSTHWISFADSLFIDLKPLISPDTVPDLTTYAGKGEAVYQPNFLDVHVFYWNKEMFEQAGLDPEKPPASFDEWFADCDKLKTEFPDKYCFDWHISNPNNTFAYWDILLSAAGGKMYSDDLKTVAFNTPEGLAALQAFETMQATKKYVDPVSLGIPDQTQPAQRFSQGLTPTLVNWASAWTATIHDQTKSKVIGKVGVAIMPGIGGNKSGSMDGWDGLAVSRFSKNQDVAAAYADWWTNIESQTAIVKAFGTIPTRKSLIATSATGDLGAALKAAGEEYNYPVNRFPSPFYTPVAEVFDTVLHDLASGKINAKTAQEQLTTKVQQKIDEYWANQ